MQRFKLPYLLHIYPLPFYIAAWAQNGYGFGLCQNGYTKHPLYMAELSPIFFFDFWAAPKTRGNENESKWPRWRFRVRAGSKNSDHGYSGDRKRKKNKHLKLQFFFRSTASAAANSKLFDPTGPKARRIRPFWAQNIQTSQNGHGHDSRPGATHTHTHAP